MTSNHLRCRVVKAGAGVKGICIIFVTLEGNTALPLPLGNLNEFIIVANLNTDGFFSTI